MQLISRINLKIHGHMQTITQSFHVSFLCCHVLLEDMDVFNEEKEVLKL